ncbi:WbqC family protein [Chitinophaga nivalis]|uniref:WbqC family protein n=1 Tax=Chitinophaga nivalis TaxID=2991709 RepID=A0ABT3IPU6_9BACT|nr:WbqC family protein [Chitinophaga nivalis]MCW3464321.1 WbqC family protein [Chitinophaga nivalis]MCW3485988.1 WbqC family protein [Chitinophaga nivalis]
MTENAGNGTLLIESQYFPPIDVYKTLIKYDTLQIEKYEHYQKLSYRNRCYVAGPNGRMILSVPLSRGKNQRTVMKDVRISNEEQWQALHWKTLVSAYRRSPWFEYYEAELELLFQREFNFLLDWNLACLEWVHSKLGLQIPVTFTESYQQEVTGVTDFREQVLPGTVAADAPEYTQVFQDRTGFIPGLSVLDLLFCEGKQSLEVIKKVL